MESFIVWLVVGLIAGVLASAVTRSSTSLLENVIVGVAGAFIGGLIFGGGVSFSVMSILVAFVGAVVLLLLIKVVRQAVR